MADGRVRRCLRWSRRTFFALAAVYVGTLVAGVPFGWPFDAWVNAGDTVAAPEYHTPADGVRRVVVLQHGMFRSSWALGRLARSLAANGYEVHNLDYPSTSGTLAEHAARLRDGIEAIAAAGPIGELSFVGHSMGGLVVQEYLRRPDARPATSCVYLAVPHRGALLADLRKHWFLFRWVMGEKAAMQLSPGDPFHRQPIPRPVRAGAIVGDIGEGNASIPGRDDGTVAVGEAVYPGVDATVVLPYGHTRIAYAPETIRQVLTFLRTGGFAPVGGAR